MPIQTGRQLRVDLSYDKLRSARAQRPTEPSHSPSHLAAAAGMEPEMNARNDKLASFSPQLWVATVMATLVAVALLFAFVQTLHDHLRQGEELRRTQVAALHRPAFAGMANAVTVDAAHSIRPR